MKKDVSPDLYNYNKFPGPSFARVGDMVVAQDIELRLVEEYREAFDQTAFGQRFSIWMLQYDYIVGDWGNEQLRLKGFYAKDKGETSKSIAEVEDYLREYCNFGCAYFILENEHPVAYQADAEEEMPPRRRRRRRNRRRSGDKAHKEKTQTSEHKESRRQASTSSKEFHLMKVEKNRSKTGSAKKERPTSSTSRERKIEKKTEGSHGFVIRQK